MSEADWKQTNNGPSLKTYTPDSGPTVKAVATAAELIEFAPAIEAVKFNWIGLTSAYLTWKKTVRQAPKASMVRAARGDLKSVEQEIPQMVHFAGQVFDPNVVGKAYMILPLAVRQGSLQKFTDLLVEREIATVECLQPDLNNPYRVLRLHRPAQPGRAELTITLRPDLVENEKKVPDDSGK